MLAAQVVMNPEVKADWLAALRGGEYQQGKGVLRTADDKFCCLGVLCDLAVKAGVIPAPTDDDLAEDDIPMAGGGYERRSAYGYADTYTSDDTGEEVPQKEMSYLPQAVADWSGVPRFGDRWWEPDAEEPKENLAGLNDEGKSFAEIADIIEAEY